jgi:ribosomal protein S19
MLTEDVGIAAGKNVAQKTEKLKSKGLCMQLIRTWNMICVIIPVILGATAIVTKCLKKRLEAIPGKHSYIYLESRT